MLKTKRILHGTSFKLVPENDVLRQTIDDVGAENIVQIASDHIGTNIFYEDSFGPRTTCPGCHNFICPEDDFCMTCGAPLRETTCPSCGYHVRPGAKFCTKCGKNLLEKK